MKAISRMHVISFAALISIALLSSVQGVEPLVLDVPVIDLQVTSSVELPQLGTLPPASDSGQGNRLITGAAALPGMQSPYNRIEPGHCLAIFPGGEDDLAHAIYGEAGLLSERPVSITMHVEPAKLHPGGEEDLPLGFWLVVANYSANRWDWFGTGSTHFSGLAQVQINSPALNQRYISPHGTMYFAIVTASAPGIRYGVKVNSVAITVLEANNPDYLKTVPAVPTVSSANVAPEGNVRVQWSHLQTDGAEYYSVYRMSSGGVVEALGTVPAPVGATGEYFDPQNNSAADRPLSGVTYTYMLAAGNLAGATNPYDSLSQPVVVP